jgi:sulfate permease, SulP family
MALKFLNNSTAPSKLDQFLPMLAWMPHYDRASLVTDIIAGSKLWGLVVPQGMAFAGVAGLPAQAGLYTLGVSLFVYALFSSSHHLSVGATSATAALIASTAIAMGATQADMTTYYAYATALVMVIGVVFLVASLARLGWVTQFLSKPVTDGVVTGLAIFVAVGQLNKLFGVEKGDGNVFQKLFGVIKQRPEANWVTFAAGSPALALLFLLPRWNNKIPASLIGRFVSITVSAVLNPNANYGVALAVLLPQGLPSINFPKLPLKITKMILPAIGIFLVPYRKALGAVREFIIVYVAELHGTIMATLSIKI